MVFLRDETNMTSVEGETQLFSDPDPDPDLESIRGLTMEDVEQFASKLVEKLVGDPEPSTLAVYRRTETPDGTVYEDWVPFRFKIIPEEVGFNKSILYQLILYGGGVVSTRVDDQHCITLLNDMTYVLDKSLDVGLPPDIYSSRLIYDAITRKRRRLPLPDAREYLVTFSQYAAYDPWKILRKELKWSDLPRVTLPERVLRAQQVARMGFEAFMEKYSRNSPGPKPRSRPVQNQPRPQSQNVVEVGASSSRAVARALFPSAAPEKIANEPRPSPPTNSGLDTSGSQEMDFGEEKSEREARSAAAPEGPTVSSTRSVLEAVASATEAPEAAASVTKRLRRRDRLTPPPPSPDKSQSSDRCFGKSDDEVTVVAARALIPIQADPEEQVPATSTPAATQVIPRTVPIKYEEEGGFFRTQDMDEVVDVPDSSSQGEDTPPTQNTVPLRPLRSTQPQPGPCTSTTLDPKGVAESNNPSEKGKSKGKKFTQERNKVVDMDVTNTADPGPDSTSPAEDTTPAEATVPLKPAQSQPGSSTSRALQRLVQSQNPGKDIQMKSSKPAPNPKAVVDYSNFKSNTQATQGRDIDSGSSTKDTSTTLTPAEAPSQPQPGPSTSTTLPQLVPSPGKDIQVKSSRPVPISLVPKAVAGPSNKRRKKDKPTSTTKGQGKSDDDNNNDDDNDGWIDCSSVSSDAESIQFDGNSDSGGSVSSTKANRQRGSRAYPRKPFYLEEEQLIIDKICKAKAFRWSGGTQLFKYMEESKDFKGIRTYQSLYSRWKIIKPKLLGPQHPYKISKEDLNSLKKANQDAKFNPHKYLCPDNLKFE